MEVLKQANYPKEIALMNLSRKAVQRKSRIIPQLRFEDQNLTSFAGLIIFQALFSNLNLRHRIARCFRHLKIRPAYDFARLMLALIVHLLLGFRSLRDLRFYQDDPVVLRILGLKRLPDVATLSRMLKNLDQTAINMLRKLVRDLVLQRLTALSLPRITLDCDGSVLGTARKAEGTAVGFNKKKKGHRSYYPLFVTVAQTGQVLDFLHRSGNVHDSNGACQFLLECLEMVRSVMPGVKIEMRMDSAFFSDEMVTRLQDAGVEVTISVPFHRFVELKSCLESRKVWYRLNAHLSYFELSWKPKSWSRKFRFLAIRTLVKSQDKGPVQLDLFKPISTEYEFKVVVTNKTINARKVVAFHNGRGSQEGVFAELKSQGQMDYIPVRTRCGNQAYQLAAILAHNLSRELQMQCRPVQRRTTEKRPPLWRFEQLETLRRKIIQRAGRLTRPQGNLTLTFSANKAVQKEIVNYLEVLQAA